MDSNSLLMALASLLVTSNAIQLADLVPQSFTQKRATYQGGWALALPGADCPADAPVACSTWSGAVNPTCCPNGQFCKGVNWPHCCPTNTDCVSVVENLPVCANSTWNMYRIDKTDYFCCEPGQIGILGISGYTGICGYPDQGVAASLIATPASQIGGVAVTTIVGNTGGGAAPTSTKTITSSLKNGGVTTITSIVGAAATDVSGSTATGTGSSASSSSTSTTKDTKKLGTGVIIGIAVGAGLLLVIAVLVYLLIRSKRRNNRNPTQENTQGHQYGGNPNGSAAPMYSADPIPYQPPVQEYKTPAVGYVQPVLRQQGGVPAQGRHGGGYVRSQEGQAQQGYGFPTPPPQHGSFEPPPVEAPNQWERGVEIGGGGK